MNKPTDLKPLAHFSLLWRRPAIAPEEIGRLLKSGYVETRRPRRHLTKSALFRLTAKGLKARTARLGGEKIQFRILKRKAIR